LGALITQDETPKDVMDKTVWVYILPPSRNFVMSVRDPDDVSEVFEKAQMRRKVH